MKLKSVAHTISEVPSMFSKDIVGITYGVIPRHEFSMIKDIVGIAYALTPRHEFSMINDLIIAITPPYNLRKPNV